MVYALLKPKFFIPVHGEYKHLQAHKNLIQEMGHPSEDIFLMNVGDVLELDKVHGEIVDAHGDGGHPGGWPGCRRCRQYRTAGS